MADPTPTIVRASAAGAELERLNDELGELRDELRDAELQAGDDDLESLKLSEAAERVFRAAEGLGAARDLVATYIGLRYLAAGGDRGEAGS